MNKKKLIKQILLIGSSCLLYMLMQFICNKVGTFDAFSYIMGGISISIYGVIFERIGEKI